MSNMFYRFIEHTFITRQFQVFHVFENCWKGVPLKVITPVLLWLEK